MRLLLCIFVLNTPALLLNAHQSFIYRRFPFYSNYVYKKQSEKELRDKKIMHAVLASFGQIVAHILNIMQDPENRENVTLNASLMAGNIINMVVQATKHCKQELNNDEEKTALTRNGDDAFQEQLVTIIIKQMQKNHLKFAHYSS
jgi:hypothetical protein